ncbi:MAG: hypothetical protein J7L91_01105 [Candidatus Korarchaeota archaeon]|nr:hypothetical protein [Candidatus Korarchaeota archaeon]
MGFFKSWEDALKRRSESESMKMRKSVLVGELRNIQRISKDPKRVGSIINSILNEKIEESKISEIEKLFLQLGDSARSSKGFDNILSKIEKILH